MQTDVVRKLYVVRHCEAETDNPNGDEHRELTQEGLAVATKLGKALHDADAKPDAVLCSQATRAVQTMKEMLDQVQEVNVEPTVSWDFYRCFAEGWVKALTVLEPTVAQALLIGHQPVLSSLIRKLSGSEVSMRPGTAFLLEFNGTWQALPGVDVSATEFFPGASR